MKAAGNIISLLLIITMLSTALPLFTSEDANRDTRVGIEDAILHVQDFARTANSPAAFTANIKNVISTMQALAGLKTVIKAEGDAKSTTTPPCFDSPYLISSYTLFSPLYFTLRLIENPLDYKSITITPSSPPPQPNFFC